MNWGRLTSGNPVVTHAAVTICLVVSGYLAVVPFQEDDHLLEGLLLVDTTHSIAIQEEISDWIVSEGDSIQTGQIIGYTLSKQHRQTLEALMTIGSLDQSLVINRIRDLLDSVAISAGPSRSWIGSHLIQSKDRSAKRVNQPGPNRLQEFNRALADIEEKLGFLRRRRLNQAGSEHAEADLAEMNTLEKAQMNLRRQINAEILQSERSAPQSEKQFRWTLNAPLDSLVYIAKSEFEQAQIVATRNGRLTKVGTETAGNQYRIVSETPQNAILELETGSALKTSENALIKMNFRDKEATIQNQTLSGRIVGVQHQNDKIRLTLEITNQEQISRLSKTTKVHIQSDVQEQMTIFGLLTSREL